MSQDPIQFTKQRPVDQGVPPDLSHYASPEKMKSLLEEQNKQPVKPLIKEYTGPKETIQLPSKGVFYSPESPLSSGVVDIKYMTAKEEDILMSQQLIKNGTMMDVLLRAVIVTPGVVYDDLLLGDKTAIFLHARRLAYGDVYECSQECPKCGQSSKTQLVISELQAKEFGEANHVAGTNSFEFTLPASKKVITFKLLTVGDERKIDQELKALEKVFGAKAGKASPELTTRFKYMITAIDGKEQKSAINAFVDNEMLAKDSIAFRSYLKEVSPDYKFTYQFECSSCGHSAELPYNLGADFILPDASASM